ncbi:MAG: Yip1 family protein [Thermoanaerobaculia bacterium]
MTIDSTQPVTPTAEPAPKSNVFQRIAGVLFAPAKTFEEIARRPDLLAPLAIIVLISLIVTVMIVPKMDFEATVREQMESSGRNMSEQDMDRAARFGAAFAKTTAYASPILTIPVLAIIAGILLLAFRLFGGEGGFKQAFSVTIYAWFPHIIASIITAIIVVSRGTVTADEVGTAVLSNLGAFVDMKEQAVLYALLSSIDIFSIWTLTLLTFGFAAVSRMSKAKAAVIVVSLWVVTVVIKIALAAFGAAAKAKA